MLVAQPPSFTSALPMFHDDGIRACVEPVGMSPSQKKKKQAKKPAEDAQRREIVPPCSHNSWDNVRVIKGHVTLRCRVCQVQWRTFVDSVWRKKKCGYFNTPEGCTMGERCTKIHLHARKQSLAERIDLHGLGVLAQVPVEAIPKAVKPFAVKPMETKIQAERPCGHNNWDNVRVKKGLVTLRCRTCQKQWRRPLENLPRCPDFPNCQNGEGCEKLHLHAFKQSLAQRMGSHGSAVLNKVPPCVWNGAPPENGIYVTCEGVPLNWPQALTVEGVQAWHDSTAEHRNIPAMVIGGILLRGPSMGVGAGMKFSVHVPRESEVFVLHEPGVKTFEKDGAWEMVTPSLAKYTAEGDVVTLPPTEKQGELFSIIVKQPCRVVSTIESVGSCSSSERCFSSENVSSRGLSDTEDVEEEEETSSGLSRCPSTPNMRWSGIRRVSRSASCPPICRLY